MMWWGAEILTFNIFISCILYRPVQGEPRLSPNDGWDRLQPPRDPTDGLSGNRNWMDDILYIFTDVKGRKIRQKNPILSLSAHNLTAEHHPTWEQAAATESVWFNELNKKYRRSVHSAACWNWMILWPGRQAQNKRVFFTNSSTHFCIRRLFTSFSTNELRCWNTSVHRGCTMYPNADRLWPNSQNSNYGTVKIGEKPGKNLPKTRVLTADQGRHVCKMNVLQSRK